MVYHTQIAKVKWKVAIVETIIKLFRTHLYMITMQYVIHMDTIAQSINASVAVEKHWTPVNTNDSTSSRSEIPNQSESDNLENIVIALLTYCLPIEKCMMGKRSV